MLDSDCELFYVGLNTQVSTLPPTNSQNQRRQNTAQVCIPRAFFSNRNKYGAWSPSFKSMSRLSPSTQETQSNLQLSLNAKPEGEQTKLYHHEDRLAKTWKSMTNWMVIASQKAENAAVDPTKPVLRELDEYVVAFLRSKLDWGKLISYLEAKLEGKAKEMETLQQYVRTQPKLGRSKRKREDEKREEETKTAALESFPSADTADIYTMP